MASGPHVAEEPRPVRQILREMLLDEPSIDLAVLFGSVARGDERADSDVDLLIGAPSEDLARLGALGLQLERAIGREVDVVALEDAASEPRFLLEVLDRGEPVLDRDGRWAALRLSRGGTAAAAVRRRAEQTQAAHAGWAVLTR